MARVVSAVVFQRMRAALGRVELERRVRQLEQDGGTPGVEDLRSEIDRAVHEAVRVNEAVLLRRLDQLAEAVEEVRSGLAANRRHTEEAVAAVHQAAFAAAREHTEAAVEVSAQALIRRIETLRRAQQVAPATTPDTSASAAPGPDAAAAPVIDPALYIALEDRFRGDPAMIEQRQRAYVGYVEDVVDAEHPLLDLGSGRGEWLRVLAEHAVPAIGVDSNPVSVLECRDAGLEVVEGDLVRHLAERPAGSLGAVTMFQVVEHLPFPVLVSTLAAAARALRPGGVLIAETPNATNLRVAASTFWIDPTHQRPVHPEVLVFLAIECGFADVERVFANRLGPVPDVAGLPRGAAETVRRLAEEVDGPGDFALVARVP